MNKKSLPSVALTLNLLIVGLLFYLPYYLFDGRLFLGGDDTRFYYGYPEEVLQNLARYSWITISSLPSNIPNFHSIPFLLVSVLLNTVFQSKNHLFNFLFSLPLVLGFIYIQKFIRVVIGAEYIISIVASLIFILSPITVVSHISHFLTPVWLIALVPIISYHYICFIRGGSRRDIILAVLWSIFLSIAYFALVWVLGILLSLFSGVVFMLIFRIYPVKKVLKRTVLFITFIITSQLFWVIPFVMSMVYKGETELGGKIVSKEFIDSFSPTIIATATGNIIYPLLSFYHRQIAIDYNWQLKNAFLSYWDFVLPLSMIYILVLFLGVNKYAQVLKKETKTIFIFIFISFLSALYYFTVNIGFLKYIFLLFGHIPGFSIFRNFTDKFSLGYIYLYSILISICLFIVKKSYPKIFPFVIASVFIVTLINFYPVRQIINSPVWTTEKIYKTTNISIEYIEFTKRVKSILPNTANIFALPQNIASYSIITEDNGINAYIGTSPFKFFTGINDLSGVKSYPDDISLSIQNDVSSKNYQDLLKTFERINVGYMMVTNNIPDEILHSYLFDVNYLKIQNKELIDSIADSEVVRSSNGNYVLFKLKNSPSIISPVENIRYTKINPIKYEVNIANLNNDTALILKETYHPGWRLYLKNETRLPYSLLNFGDIEYLFTPSLFDSSHRDLKPYGNSWTLKLDEISRRFDGSLLQKNTDGSINVKFTIYFYPQLYFTIGTITSLIGLLLGSIYISYRKI